MLEPLVTWLNVGTDVVVVFLIRPVWTQTYVEVPNIEYCGTFVVGRSEKSDSFDVVIFATRKDS